MLVVRRVPARAAAALQAAVAVGDVLRAGRHRGVDRGTQISHGRAARLNQQQVAPRADGRHDVQVQRRLNRPSGRASQSRERAGITVLVNNAEATTTACWQTPCLAVYGQVRAYVRVTERAD